MLVIFGVDVAAQHVAAVEVAVGAVLDVLQLVDVVDGQGGGDGGGTIAPIGRGDLVVSAAAAQLVGRRAGALYGHTGAVGIGRAVDVKGGDVLVVMLRIVR